ncbi:MAG: cysteine-rich CWC family protein [bacterium]|nr:cysteine-rich CWC family protein [bacterium]
MIGEEHRCPVCGEHNDCDLARGKGSCWCFHERVDTRIVDLLAERGIEDRCLCPKCAAGDVPSPCVGTCVLDQSSQTCRGCRRTLPQIAVWSTLDPVERAKIWLRSRES